MKKKSAGLLMYRFNNGILEFFLGHMGGPFWSKKDERAWSIPKGEYTDDEDPFEAAKREFREETSLNPEGEFIELKTIKQSSGKQIIAWACEGDCDPSKVKSNTFSLEWPPRSGKFTEFPEIDRADWFPSSIAKKKIIKGQIGFIEELCLKINYDASKESNLKSDNKEQLTLFD